MKDISRQEAQDLREMARLAFRNSVGATEDDAVSFNHRDYSTLDLNFLWHFKMLVEADEREACAKLCDELHNGSLQEFSALAGEIYNEDCAAAIRTRSEK